MISTGGFKDKIRWCGDPLSDAVGHPHCTNIQSIMLMLSSFWGGGVLGMDLKPND